MRATRRPRALGRQTQSAAACESTRHRVEHEPSVAMPCSTAWLMSLLTTAVPLTMRDTVLGDTPAARATISSVSLPAWCAGAAAPLRRRDGATTGFFFFMSRAFTRIRQ